MPPKKKKSTTSSKTSSKSKTVSSKTTKIQSKKSTSKPKNTLKVSQNNEGKRLLSIFSIMLIVFVMVFGILIGLMLSQGQPEEASARYGQNNICLRDKKVNVTFVVDTSSSMKGEKWDNVKDAIISFVSNLDETYHDYELVTFDKQAEHISLNQQNVEIKMNQIQMDRENVHDLQAGLSEAIQLVMADKFTQDLVFVITNGAINNDKVNLIMNQSRSLIDNDTIVSVIAISPVEVCEINNVGEEVCKYISLQKAVGDTITEDNSIRYFEYLAYTAGGDYYEADPQYFTHFSSTPTAFELEQVFEEAYTFGCNQ